MFGIEPALRVFFRPGARLRPPAAEGTDMHTDSERNPLLLGVEEPTEPSLRMQTADPRDSDGTDGDEGDGTDGTDGSDSDGTDGDDSDEADGDSDGTDGSDTGPGLI